MLTHQQIESIVEIIVKGYKPEKVILFGSYANGTPCEDSDLDFCIIKNTSTRNIERPREVRRLFNSYPWSMDIFVYTPQEFKKRKKVYGSLAYIVSIEGKTIYG